MKRTVNEQKDILRRYLLHSLGEAEQEQLELRLLTDKQFGRLIAIAQDDLVDDFVAARLSEEEVDRFQEYYMTTPERRQKLRFATVLDRYVSEDRPTEEVDVSGKLRLLFRSRTLKTAFSAAGILLIFGVALFVMFRLGWFHPGSIRDLQGEFARVNRSQETDSRPLSELKRNSTNTLALILRQNLVREDGVERAVEISRSVTLIRLLLEVPTASNNGYTAVLQTTVGQELARVGDLKARNEDGAQFVVVNVPAEFLTRGDYQLRLIGISGDGLATDIGLYPFHVTTK